MGHESEIMPIKVSLVDISGDAQKRLLPRSAVPRDRVLITNSSMLTLGSQSQILAHAPKRRRGIIVVNGAGLVAFGKTQSECVSAQGNASGEYISSVSYVNAPATIDIRATTDLWAGLISANWSVPAILATPSVPATGVAVQNLNPFAVTVVIGANGATITNVSVNGVTVGTAARTYIVPSGGSISIAYTVATPTMAWSSAVYNTPTIVSAFKEIGT